jgi:hypothetical protein
MAAVLNRTTKQYLASANTPDYPVEEWIINPDMSAVVGSQTVYWVITGDVVSLMSQAERDAVDAVAVQSARDAAIAQLQQAEDVLRAFMLIVLDDRNLLAARLSSLLDAIDGAGSFAALKNAAALIANPPQYTEAQLRTAIRNRIGT